MIKIAFYISGIIISLGVVAWPIVFGHLPVVSEEIGPLLFTFLWAFLPFAALPNIGVASRRALFAAVLIAGLFWIMILTVASHYRGDVAIGLGFLGFLSPIFIGLTVLAIEKMFGPK